MYSAGVFVQETKKSQYLRIHFEEDPQWIKRCEIRSNGYGMGNQTLNGSGTVLEQKKRIFNGLEIENPFLDQLLLVQMIVNDKN